MSTPIINVADAKTHSESGGEHFSYSMSLLAGAVGGKAIGANLTRVPPGKAAFPFHHHYANEEHFFILSGTGMLRLGSETYAVKPQDYIVNPPGGAEQAHQLINTGSEDLVYLAISSMRSPEVVGYPDSAKTLVRTSYADTAVRFLLDDTSKRQRSFEEYWRGEDGARVAAIAAKK